MYWKTEWETFYSKNNIGIHLIWFVRKKHTLLVFDLALNLKQPYVDKSYPWLSCQLLASKQSYHVKQPMENHMDTLDKLGDLHVFSRKECATTGDFRRP